MINAEAYEILAEVRQASIISETLSHAMYCAKMHAWLGESDQIFEWPEKACAER